MDGRNGQTKQAVVDGQEHEQIKKDAAEVIKSKKGGAQAEA